MDRRHPTIGTVPHPRINECSRCLATTVERQRARVGGMFGVVTVPMSWVSARFANGWYGWSTGLVIGATLTALFLWWRSRRKHTASELNRDSSDGIST